MCKSSGVTQAGCPGRVEKLGVTAVPESGVLGKNIQEKACPLVESLGFFPRAAGSHCRILLS